MSDTEARIGVLAIAGGKGGTGKTTTALALARAIAADCTGDRTSDEGNDRAAPLVVDADLDMPDLHAMVGVDRTPTFLERPRGHAVPEFGGIRVAPAPSPDATARFRQRLQRDSATSVGPVLVDAPCGAGPDAAVPLDAADGVVLVTRPTPVAVRDAAKTAAMARALETPVVAAVVVDAPGERPSRTVPRRAKRTSGGPVGSLREVFEVDVLVRVPRVDGDPLSATGVQQAIERLLEALRSGQTPFYGAKAKGGGTWRAG